MTFEVHGDGGLLAEPGLLTGHGPAEPLDVDVSGVEVLRLVTTDGGDGNGYDHADWLGARLTC